MLYGIMSFEIIKQLRGQPKYIHNLDALSILSNYMGEFCAIVLFQRKNDPEIIKTCKQFKKIPIRTEELITEIDKMLRNAYDEIDSRVSVLVNDLTSSQKKSIQDLDEHVTNMTHGIKNMSPTFLLYIIKLSTLKKLCMLWDQYEGFELGIRMGSKYAKKTTSD